MKQLLKALIGLFVFYVIPGILVGLSSCRTVKKSQESLTQSSSTSTIVDTVHVSKIDTSFSTHEIINYQTKVVELYDTVRTVKDSVVVRLVSRITYTNGPNEKTVVKAGTGYDSTAKKNKSDSTGNKEEKKTSVDKKTPWWQGLVFPGIVIAVLAILILIGKRMLKKPL